MDGLTAQPQLDRSDEAGFIGWSVIHLDLDTASSGELVVFRRNVFSGWFWCLALAGAALASWLRQGRTIGLLVMLSLAPALALPQPWSVLAQGVAIGMTLGGVRFLLEKRPWSITAHRGPDEPTTRLRAAAGAGA